MPSDTRSSIDLTITGRKCRIHRNDRVARSLEEGANLIELGADIDYNSWNGDDEKPSIAAPRPPALQVERNDARTLLDEISLQQICDQRRGMDNIDAGISKASSECASQPLGEEGTEEEIADRNFVRYGGLAEYSSHFLKGKSNDKSKDGEEVRTATRNKSRWGSTASCDGKQAKNNARDEEQAPFELSAEKLKGMPSDIPFPKTMRHNTIIEHTASRSASNNQLEVFLKVKQDGNTDFSFLNSSDGLHRYYLYLKGKYGKANDALKNNEDDDVGSDSDASDNPLSGLLGGYLSSDDESNGPTSKENAATGDNSESKQEPLSSGGDSSGVDVKSNEGDTSVEAKSKEEDKKRKADRLERVRLWKASRLKQDDSK